MRPGAAHEESWYWTLVPAVPELRAHDCQLIQRKFPVKNMAPMEAKTAFQFERGDHLRRQYQTANAGRESLERRKHALQHGFLHGRPAARSQPIGCVVHVNRHHMARI